MSAGSTHQQFVGSLYRDHRDWLLNWLRRHQACPHRAEEQLQVLQALREVNLMLGALSANARAAFFYNRLDGLTHAEIASRLGVSVPRVRQYLAQALRQCYIAVYGEPR